MTSGSCFLANFRHYECLRMAKALGLLIIDIELVTYGNMEEFQKNKEQENQSHPFTNEMVLHALNTKSISCRKV